MSETTLWTHTRVALKNFIKLLACNKCKQRPTEPIRYFSCQHLFCSNCVKQDTNCFVCGVPVQPNDILVDHITSTIVAGCDSIIDIIFEDGDQETGEESEWDEGHIAGFEKQSNILSSTRLSRTSINKESLPKKNPNTIVEESDGSDETEKMEDLVDDTVKETYSDELENLTNTAIAQNKTVKKPKKIGRPMRQSQENSTSESKKVSKDANKENTKRKTLHKTSSEANTKKIPKDVNKKNNKGESLLHQACLKRDEERVKFLLENGANPNTKDYSNWTPLQEAVNFGLYNICEFLLENGAFVDTPGKDNKTALHEAVINNKCKEAALLLRYDANPNVFDQYGKKPIDYCQSEEMKKLFQENVLDETAEKLINVSNSLNRSISSSINKIVVLGCNLNEATLISLSELVEKHKIKVVNSFVPSVTHVLVEPDQQFFPNYDLLLSILHGKWILSSEWIQIGLTLDKKDLMEMDLDIFEMKFLTYDDTPYRARMNVEKQNPGLFNNCYFFFALNATETYTIGQLSLTKTNLSKLSIEGGGNCLTREPDPEHIENQLIPFHAANDENNPLHNCSHYIIYAPGKEEPRIKYNMPHLKTLPLVWFIECIEKFTLVNPVLFGIV